jgi:hypothetical protein
VADTLTNLPPGTSLATILNVAGVTSEAIKAATFCTDIPTNKDDSLLLMVKNFYAMSDILADLGLGGHQSDPFVHYFLTIQNASGSPCPAPLPAITPIPRWAFWKAAARPAEKAIVMPRL